MGIKGRRFQLLNCVAIVATLLMMFPSMGSASRCEMLFSPKSISEVYYSLISGEGANEKASTGVEVEAMIPKVVGLHNISETAADTLENMGYNIEKLFYYQPVGQAYKTKTFHISWTKNNRKYDLKISQDFSVRPEKGYEAIEVVSPILYDSEDAEEYYKIISAMRELGLKEEPNNSGVHVHVGVANLTPAELGLITWTFHLLEEKIRQNISFSNFRSYYVGQKKAEEIEAIKTFAPLQTGVTGHLDTYYPNKKDRYVGVNIASLRKFGTIEIRLFNSSVHPRVLRFARHLARKVIQKVRQKDSQLLEVVKRAEFGDVNLDDLFENIGMSKTHVWEIYSIMRQEIDQAEITDFEMKLRTLGLLPQTVSAGWYRAIVFPDKAPPGWTQIEDQ